MLASDILEICKFDPPYKKPKVIHHAMVVHARSSISFFLTWLWTTFCLKEPKLEHSISVLAMRNVSSIGRDFSSWGLRVTQSSPGHARVTSLGRAGVTGGPGGGWRHGRQLVTGSLLMLDGDHDDPPPSPWSRHPARHLAPVTPVRPDDVTPAWPRELWVTCNPTTPGMKNSFHTTNYVHNQSRNLGFVRHSFKWKNSILTYIHQMRAKLSEGYKDLLVFIVPIATIGVVICVYVGIPQSLALTCLPSTSMPHLQCKWFQSIYW